MHESTWALMSEIKNEFDFVFRTNVSSYWNPTLLLAMLRNKHFLTEGTIWAKVGSYTMNDGMEIR